MSFQFVAISQAAQSLHEVWNEAFLWQFTYFFCSKSSSLPIDTFVRALESAVLPVDVLGGFCDFVGFLVRKFASKGNDTTETNFLRLRGKFQSRRTRGCRLMRLQSATPGNRQTDTQTERITAVTSPTHCDAARLTISSSQEASYYCCSECM